MILRHSSRRAPIADLVRGALRDAVQYDRIAGYFSSSILEVAGEELEAMVWSPGAPPCVRVVCNSELDARDVATAKAAQSGMWQEWCGALPDMNPAAQARLRRLYDLLRSGRIEVRVLPDSAFGLVHGKAGVVTTADGSSVAFLGSANETRSAWKMNYELVWADDSADAVDWVRDEFTALWLHPHAYPLADAIVADVGRLSRRTTLGSVTDWSGRHEPKPAAPIVELPVYRRHYGLWAHQKYFVKLAFEAHRQGGARYVLADEVGLGKTVQLGLVAKLIALTGTRPILVLAPKTLLEQWQDELWDLLAFPCARWNGRQWVDENGVVYADLGAEGILRCPRRIGIVSTGLVTSGSSAADRLASLRYDCVIVDEAHRARRSSGDRKAVTYNNLAGFIRMLSPRTASLLLATATPVQLRAMEAFDLLDALALGDDRVLGTRFSFWRAQPDRSLALVAGSDEPPRAMDEVWPWLANPLPPEGEGHDFRRIRRALGASSGQAAAKQEDLLRLGLADRKIAERLCRDLFRDHNPYVRHIVRRTRHFLEEAVDPSTHESYLKPVRVRLFGESSQHALTLPPYLEDAYHAADDFCKEIGKRPGLSASFLSTILLRRLGSSLVAGTKTAERMLGRTIADLDDEGHASDEADQPMSSLAPFSDAELHLLKRFAGLLGASTAEDPKYGEVERALLQGLDDPEMGRTAPWLDYGCILFSQFYDTAAWIARRLAERLPDECVAVYAGSGKSALLRGGTSERVERDAIKKGVRSGTIRLVVGTDAASEGLNLQRLGTLINVDLPWNPTRLEQRKGRIQRIGQARDEVYLLNLRYRGSVEDRVHQMLASRQETIHALFGQIPDTLEDVWVLVAKHDEAEAARRIDAVPTVHPFELRYERRPDPVDFESCAEVLTAETQMDVLLGGW